MKIGFEVKEDNKVTIYTADFSNVEKAVGEVSGKFEKFLKDTFKKETFVKEEK